MGNSKPVLVIRHVPHEGLGIFEDVLTAAGVGWRTLDLFGADQVEVDVDDYAGMIVMGGPMNVDETEQYPQLGSEVQWIKNAIDRELPVLGVCLGAQLIAKALGAKVYAGPSQEIGWYPLTMNKAAQSDPLFQICRPRETVFQWHADTFDLPRGATLLASSELYPNQAFRYGTRCYGLQFHWEITGKMLDDWLIQPQMCAELNATAKIDAAQIRRRAPDELPGMLGLAQRVLAPFARWCM
jgi:GMP synthase (glutamine-hydrolysing)